MVSEQRQSGASRGWSRCLSASWGCSLAMVSSVVVATRWNCRAAALSWMCSKSRICKEKATQGSAPPQRGQPGAWQQPRSRPWAALLGSWHGIPCVEEPESFPRMQDTLLGSNQEPAPLPSQRLEERATHRALCSTVPSTSCDQTTSSSTSIKQGEFKSGSVLLLEKYVHVVLA